MLPRAKSLAISVLCGVVVAAACSNQPEGARCDRNNGNDDCESGLVCTPSSQVTYGVQNPQTAGELDFGICCPPQNQGATTFTSSACFPATSAPGGGTGGQGKDSGTQPDAGTSAGGTGTGGTTSTGGTGTGGASSGGSAAGGSPSTGGSPASGGAPADAAAHG